MKVLEEDDGSGWVKIYKESTEKSGLVPASYLKLDSDSDEDEPVQIIPAMPVPQVAGVLRSGKFGKPPLPSVTREENPLTVRTL